MEGPPPPVLSPGPLELTLNYLMFSGNWHAELIGTNDRHFLCTLRIKNIFLWLLANRQIEILELGDLEKECSLARIRLTLAQHDPAAVAVAGRNAAIWGHQQQASGPARQRGVLDQCARQAKHRSLLLRLLTRGGFGSLADTMVATNFPVSTGSSSAEEMVSLLVQAGLFDTAISLCQTFKLPLTPVFEGLAFKYVWNCLSVVFIF